MERYRITWFYDNGESTQFPDFITLADAHHFLFPMDIDRRYETWARTVKVVIERILDDSK